MDIGNFVLDAWDGLTRIRGQPVLKKAWNNSAAHYLSEIEKEIEFIQKCPSLPDFFGASVTELINMIPRNYKQIRSYCGRDVVERLERKRVELVHTLYRHGVTDAVEGLQ